MWLLKHIGIGLLLVSNSVLADKPIFELIIREHLFYPAELVIPAGQKVKLLISNEDSTPEEFESYELNREKVILGGKKTIIFIGPLKAGEYPFFGEFNMATAQGKIIAK
ncbi:MAG: cupredoxin domain-containing protein [Colwellia sp.]|nr:cupredoxin domain-containing protein [Colwellia sp.]